MVKLRRDDTTPLLAHLPPAIHPAIVHFPIALLYVSLVVAIASRSRVGEGLAPSVRPLLFLAVVSVFAAAAAGVAAESSLPSLPPVAAAMLHTHKVFALLTGVCALMALGLSKVGIRGHAVARTPLPNWSLAFLILATAFISYTGYLGGSLVYDHGVGVSIGLRTRTVHRAAPRTSPRSIFARSAASANAQLGQTVWAESCSACHGGGTGFGRALVHKWGADRTMQFIATSMPPGAPIGRAQAAEVVAYLNAVP